jgi:molybdopterin converting factor small subunit
MEITVRFAGPLRTLAGRQEMTLPLANGTTLRDLLHTLRALLPAPFSEQVLDALEASAGPLPTILINRRHPRDQVALERLLADGDVVAFVPPMAGG